MHNCGFRFRAANERNFAARERFAAHSDSKSRVVILVDVKRDATRVKAYDMPLYAGSVELVCE